VLPLVASAIGVFVGTDIDDLVVLTALFGSRQVGRRQIVAGQYLGIATLIVIGIVAAVGLLVVPARWVGLLGVIPLGLGVRGLIRREGNPVIVRTTMGVAGITIVNGADNVTVYAPLFRGAGWGIVVYVAVFAVLVAVWIAAAAFMATRPPVVAVLDRWGHWIVPLVFIVIGLVLIVGAIVG
jgi:cadmium resistance protein CadD (predicted permease)